jgi:glycosyltransferase involved in cell wall biosynthesis
MNDSMPISPPGPDGPTPTAAALRPRTVLVLASYPWSLVVFRRTLLEAMRRQGHRVIACCPPPEPEVEDALAAMGVELETVPLARTGLDPTADLRTLKALHRLMRRLRPDLLLAYTIKPIVYGGIAARLAGVPGRAFMIEGQGYALAGESTLARLIRPVARILYRQGMRDARAVFFLNPDDERSFRDKGLLGRVAAVVRLDGIGVDLDRFAPAPLPLRPAFLLMARFLVAKGLRDYAEAARRIRARHGDVPFRLAGFADSGPGAVPAEEIAAWEREGVIENLGHLQDVRPALAASSVYVLPSYYPEGMPRSIIEAMAMGRAVVTTDHVGCRETVTHGVNGYLVPPRDVDALTSALELFLRHPERILRMGRESRRIAEARFDVHAIDARILAALGLAEAG